MKLVECVPNFSEGRDKKAIEALVAVVDTVGEARELRHDERASREARTPCFFIP